MFLLLVVKYECVCVRWHFISFKYYVMHKWVFDWKNLTSGIMGVGFHDHDIVQFFAYQSSFSHTWWATTAMQEINFLAAILYSIVWIHTLNSAFANLTVCIHTFNCLGTLWIQFPKDGVISPHIPRGSSFDSLPVVYLK